MIYVNTGGGFKGVVEVTTAEELAMLIREAYAIKDQDEYFDIEVGGAPDSVPHTVDFKWYRKLAGE